MKVILVDDEPIALDVLTILLSTQEDINIVGSYTKPFDALKEINRVRPDVIFLDIEMGELNGLEVAELFIKQLNNVEIVFVTAYSEYAVDAFELNAIDYLLKPIQEKRLNKTLERLRNKIRENYREETLENQLIVSSFGSFKVTDSVGNPLVWRTQKTKELFAYLWRRREKAVSKLAILDEVFYDKDSKKATTHLHTTIYQLRKNLKKLGYSNGILYFNNSYQLNVSLSSDLEKLEEILALKNYNDKNIRDILKVYKGDFLGEEAYHWSLQFQQLYRNRILNILTEYCREQLRENSLSTTLKLALDKLYDMDCFNENIVNMIIKYYGMQNNKTNLQIFFNNYAKDIWKDMRLKPDSTTLELYMGYMERI